MICEEDRIATINFHVRHVLIQHCGELLTPNLVESMFKEIEQEIAPHLTPKQPAVTE